jgi:hypothetical protein
MLSWIFYDLNQGFDDFGGSVLKEPVRLGYGIDKIGLGGGHRWSSQWLNVNLVIQGALIISIYCI